ncbi:MAG: arsenate reductase family protein [Culicoidibacterales bacterium]
MNIQIFGTKKCFETKKAQRYFQERKIKFQFIDLNEKTLSKGEFTSVKQAVGGIDAMINLNAKDKKTVTLIQYITPDAKEVKVFENQQVLQTPIVRNGKQATIGYHPDIWQYWE